MPAWDLYIRLHHLQDCLRQATQRVDATVGLHNQRISEQTVRNHLSEAYHALQAHWGLDLTAVHCCY